MSPLYGIGGWAPLIVLPLLLRLIPWRRREPGWRLGPELGLALVCGLIVLGMSWWLGGFHLVHGAVVGSDFAEYCASTDAARGGDWLGYSSNRSAAVGAAPAALAARLGVIDGLVAGSLLFTGLIGAGLYTWTRALAGRLAGVLSAVFFGAVGPLVLLPRTLSYYPETVWAFVGSAAGAALALRYRTPAALLAGGIGTGLALLADVRGLFWALPALGLSLLACAPRRWRVPRAWLWLPLRIALVLVPVAASYPLGTQVFKPDAPTLEVQIAGFQRDRQRALGLDAGLAGDPVFPGSYLWGYSDPRRIPQTLKTLTALRAALPAAIRYFPETVFGRATHVQPWAPLIGGALLIAVAGLWRRPWRLLALAGLLPFFVVLKSAADFLVYLRYLQAPMACFPVVLAAAAAALCSGWERPPPQGERWRWADWARPAAALALAGLIVLGGIPSALSPVAPWRQPFQANQDIPRVVKFAAARGVVHSALERRCLAALVEDIHTRGHPAGSRVYPLGGE